MRLSFSAIKEFDNCPRKFFHVRVLKSYPHEDTDATIYGKEVHKACEEYIRDGKDLGGHTRFKPMLDKLKGLSGEKYCELEMALDDNGNAVEFDDESGVLRGIADLVIVDGELARVVDYKTGSAKYPDPKQLELMALMIFAKFPDVKKVKGALLFVLHDALVSRTYFHTDFDKTFAEWKVRRNAIMSCHDTETWNPNPTGLCGWCPHKVCEYWRPRRR